jgi:hypothetical protein
MVVHGLIDEDHNQRPQSWAYTSGMASHFECIGLPVGSRDTFEATISSALERAVWTATPGGGQLALWTEPNGATVSVCLSADGAIECATPGFAATSRFRVRALGIIAATDLDAVPPDGAVVQARCWIVGRVLPGN